MKKYRSLEDANYIAIRDYINTKNVYHVILEDNLMSDFQLKTVLDGVINNNFQFLTKISYKKGDFGLESIQAINQIIDLQKMCTSQLLKKSMTNDDIGNLLELANSTGGSHNFMFQRQKTSFNMSEFSRVNSNFV